jgi:hypothetical protein
MRLACLRVLLALVGAGLCLAGCGPEAEDLTSCENVHFKERLCGVEALPVPVCCEGPDCVSPPLSDALECRVGCWLDAPCEDARSGNASADVEECLSECNALSGGMFSCGNGEMVPPEFRCDGRADCRNEADEDGCDASMLGGEFTCDDGTIIPERWRCDDRSDCDDGSDEAGC